MQPVVVQTSHAWQPVLTHSPSTHVSVVHGSPSSQLGLHFPSGVHLSQPAQSASSWHHGSVVVVVPVVEVVVVVVVGHWQSGR